jgi:branched-chain amino acid transport system substrate-binding protein
MVFKKNSMLIFLSLVLLLLIIPACGNGDEEPIATPVVTSTAIAKPVATTTATPTAQPTSSGPVKIGGITSWTGVGAISGITFADPCIKLVEKQVKDLGGILGGREVKVIRYDNRASIAEIQAGCTKLLYDEKVSAFVFGGIGVAEFEAVSNFAEEHEILYVAQGGIPDVAQRKFTVNGGVFSDIYKKQSVEAPYKIVNPKTVALLATDMSDLHERMDYRKKQLEAWGVKIVYEDYVSFETTDLSSYLTKIKYANPGVLILDSGQSEFFITIAKQMMELGGWGDIKVFAPASVDAAKNQPGTQGWYCQVLWFPQDQYPASVKFANDFKEVNGSEPRSNHMFYYNGLWVAINAIKLAGTDSDRVAIAKAARSGNLVMDTPFGILHFNTDGYSDLTYKMGQIQNKVLVPITVPE